MSTPFTTAPGLAEIEAIANHAYGTIPAVLRERVDNVVIRVVDFPDPETEREMGLANPFEILGLYRGVPLGEKSITDTPRDIDMIFLYRRPLLDYWCDTGEDLTILVRHVLIHEIGHHFGYSDAEMEAINTAG